MAFNRDRFKAARVDVNKAITKQFEDTLKINSKRGDYHQIDKGMNTFRILPPHSETDPSMQPKVVYWLLCRIPRTDFDGNEISGQFEERQRPIFDSRIHGGTPKDIVDEYIKFTKRSIFDNIQDRDEQKKKLAPINGWKGKDGRWNSGITASSSFVCYATKGEIIPSNIGRLELYLSDKNELEKLNIDDESGEPISTDIFSDPNEGISFTINRILDEKSGKFINQISKKIFVAPKGLSSKGYGDAYADFLNSQVVPDSVLEVLDGMDSLSSQFQNSYKRKTFERSLEALQLFDKKFGYNTFDNDEFLTIVEEIDAYYVDNDVEDVSKESEVTKKSVPSNKKKDFTIADLDDMTRDELKLFIAKEKLSIRVLKSMDEEAIKEAIRNIFEPEEDAIPDVEDKDIDPLPWDGVEEVKPNTQPMESKVSSLKARLAALSNKKTE